MPLGPIGCNDARFVDGLGKSPRNRYRKPLRSRRSFDDVAITPVVLGVLDAVQQNQFVRQRDHGEIPPPWYVIRLGDNDRLHDQDYWVRSVVASWATIWVR